MAVSDRPVQGRLYVCLAGEPALGSWWCVLGATAERDQEAPVESGGPGLQAVCMSSEDGRLSQRKARRVREQEQVSEPVSRQGGCRGEGPRLHTR